MELDVLGISAHPDDIELCAGGTFAKLASQGLNVGILDLTRGEMGTRGTPEIRMAEACAAADLLGLVWRGNAGLPDNGLLNTRDHQDVIISHVRALRPKIVFLNAPEDRHPDHGMGSRLANDACFYSGLAKRETVDADGRPQAPWRPFHQLHYMQDRAVFTPTFVFDITDTVAVKEQAILAYRTQFKAESDEGPQTYISSDRFWEFLRGRTRHFGHMIGVEHGEPFLYANGPVPLTGLDVLLGTRPVR